MGWTTTESATSRVGQESRAVWVTVVVVVAIAVGVYFGWPRLVVYWENMQFKQAIRANSISCLDPRVTEEGCKQKMLQEGRQKIGLDLFSEDLQINANPQTRKVVVEVNYRARLRYPLTGSMFGAKKDQFKRYRYRVVTESKYTL